MKRAVGGAFFILGFCVLLPWRCFTPTSLSSSLGQTGPVGEKSVEGEVVVHRDPILSVRPQDVLSERFRLVLAKLPARRLLAKEPSVEFAPHALSSAATVLGHLVTELKAKPELVSEGVRFYRECAQSDDLLTAVRIYCLRAMRDWSRREGQPDSRPAGVPESLWALSSRLPAAIR